MDDFIRGSHIDEKHELHEGEDPIQDAIEKGHEYEGDIQLSPEEKEIIVNGTEKDKLTLREDWPRHWPKRDSLVYLPYVLSDEYDTEERANIARAIEDYENNTCIR